MTADGDIRAGFGVTIATGRRWGAPTQGTVVLGAVWERSERFACLKGSRRSGGRRVIRAHIGLGANLGDRERTIRRALERLDAEPGVALVAVSRLRETEPEDFLDQPRFLNGAAALDTELSARELLERLLGIERELGRTRDGPRFGPRTIDLDLLLYGDCAIREHRLEVPHPRLRRRRFVLEPLAELDPELVLPSGERVREILAGLD
ncbi:MAG: 2-amino-4-hydroxy-6-hydroxymethyldihydropteridine diphosphokinase [Gaiellaceae bacterium]